MVQIDRVATEAFPKGLESSPKQSGDTRKDQNIVEEYLNNVDEVFQFLSESINKGDVMERLDTKVKKEGFNRLN